AIRKVRGDVLQLLLPQKLLPPAQADSAAAGRHLARTGDLPAADGGDGRDAGTLPGARSDRENRSPNAEAAAVSAGAGLDTETQPRAREGRFAGGVCDAGQGAAGRGAGGCGAVDGVPDVRGEVRQRN